MRFAYAILVLVFFIPFARSEEFELTPREKYFTHIAFDSSVKDKTDENSFQQRRGQIGFYTPLYSSLNTDSWSRYFKIGADINIQKLNIDTRLNSGNLEYRSTAVGLSSWILTEQHTVFMWRLGYTDLRESQGANRQIVGGLGIGTSRFSETQSLIYGFYYGYLLDDRDLILPILGWNSKFSPKWTMTVILPLSVTAKYAISETAELEIFLKPDSLRLPLKNESQYATTEETVQLRSQKFKLGAAYSYSFSPQWRLTPELGFISKQKNKIENSSGHIFAETEAPTAVYGSVKLSWQGL